MKQIRLPKDWYHHIVPLTITLVAVCVVVLAPLWAYGWAQLPFIGIFLEPNNVISALESDDWPAKAAGVQSYDLLTAVDERNVHNAAEVGEALRQIGYEALKLIIKTRTDDAYQVTGDQGPACPHQDQGSGKPQCLRKQWKGSIPLDHPHCSKPHEYGNPRS